MIAPEQPTATEFAILIAKVFAVDPIAFGGMTVTARHPELRQWWIGELATLLPANTPVKKIPINVTMDRLVGGLNLAATLGEGRPVTDLGLLSNSNNGVVVLSTAQTAAPPVIAEVCSTLDTGEVRVLREGLDLRIASQFSVVAFEAGDDETDLTPLALMDRLAFRINLEAIPGKPPSFANDALNCVRAAQDRIGHVKCAHKFYEVLAKTSLSLGIGSLRADSFAVRAARAIAALEGREAVEQDDVVRAGQLVQAWRMYVATEETDDGSPEVSEHHDGRNDSSESAVDRGEAEELQDVVVNAIESGMTPDLIGLDRTHGTLSVRASDGQSGSGRHKTRAIRGHKIGIRTAARTGDEKIDLYETIKAAVPWQRMRKTESDTLPKRTDPVVALPLMIEKSDFRFKKFKNQTGRAIIFVVDTSGSSAINRLAEAKGAVEILLSACYSRRHQVALIVFRGQKAELLLPTTRALARARRCITDLPGGGGTPLAQAIDAAIKVSLTERQKGLDPYLVFLTDGRANVTRDGKADRARAIEDCESAAASVKQLAIDGVWVDTSAKPDARLSKLAKLSNNDYLPLPFAHSRTLSQAVGSIMQ